MELLTSIKVTECGDEVVISFSLDAVISGQLILIVIFAYCSVMRISLCLFDSLLSLEQEVQSTKRGKSKSFMISMVRVYCKLQLGIILFSKG